VRSASEPFRVVRCDMEEGVVRPSFRYDCEASVEPDIIL
jgi:hypothetical protein